MRRLAVAGVEDGERGLSRGGDASAEGVELLVRVDDDGARLESGELRPGCLGRCRVDGDPVVAQRRKLLGDFSNRFL